MSAGQRVAPSSREIPRAASVTAAVSCLAGPRGMIRSVSPTIPIAPTAWPEWSKIGEAMLDSPRIASSFSRAKPRSRISCESSPERRGRERSARQPWERLGEQVGDDASGAYASIALPSALACKRQLGADLEDLERRVRPEDVVDDDDARAVHHADANGRVRPGCEPVGVDSERDPQLVQVEVGVAELEQARAELVLVRVAVLLDEAVGLERLEQAVDGGRVSRGDRRSR